MTVCLLHRAKLCLLTVFTCGMLLKLTHAIISEGKMGSKRLCPQTLFWTYRYCLLSLPTYFFRTAALAYVITSNCFAAYLRANRHFLAKNRILFGVNQGFSTMALGHPNGPRSALWWATSVDFINENQDVFWGSRCSAHTLQYDRAGVANQSDAKSRISCCVSAKSHIMQARDNDRISITTPLIDTHALLSQISSIPAG